MSEINIEQVKTRLRKWLTRRTIISSYRRVGELPLTIGTDKGAVREENQDRVAVLKLQIGPNHSCIIAALCDGMGGMEEGSICAAQTIASFFAACCAFSDVAPTERMVRAAHDANRMVHSLYHGEGGATLSAVMLDTKRGMAGINIGDSRIYTYQKSVLEQVTTDDTLAGLLPKVEEDSHPRNELLQFIGIGEGLEPHPIILSESSELIVLTSDGVHFLAQDTMQRIIRHATDPAIAAKRLIELTQWCGGRDNASIAIVAPVGSQWRKIEDPEVLQIWDPFGELQIVLPGVVESGLPQNPPPAESLTPPIENHKPQKNRSGLQKAKAKPKKKKKSTPETPLVENNSNAVKDNPQLKISFDGEQSENRHV